MSAETFPVQIAYNLIPQIGGFDEQGYSSEEMKLQNEGRKILHDPAPVSYTHLDVYKRQHIGRDLLAIQSGFMC